MKEFPEPLIEAFLTEFRMTDIARKTGLSKTTVYKYKDDPDFQSVLTDRRSAMVSAAVDRMTAYMTEDVEILQAVIRDPDTSAQTKVNAIQVMMNQLQTWTTTTDILRRLQAIERADLGVSGRSEGACETDDESIS